MKLDPEAIYLQLGQLVASMPDLVGTSPPTLEVHQWLGRAAALVEASGDRVAALSLQRHVDNLASTTFRAQSAHSIAAIVHRALARAEMAAPAAAQGAFIAAGDTFNAFAAVAKVFGRAKQDLLLVDGYADASILTDYAVTAPEGVEIRVITAFRESRRDILRPAVERWVNQYGTTRPLSVRMVPAASLHDRLILVDGAEAWIAGQSFNGMAERAHTSLVRADADLASMKVSAYEAMWLGAGPL